jgi:hypothetical protein
MKRLPEFVSRTLKDYYGFHAGFMYRVDGKKAIKVVKK